MSLVLHLWRLRAEDESLRVSAGDTNTRGSIYGTLIFNYRLGSHMHTSHSREALDRADGFWGSIGWTVAHGNRVNAANQWIFPLSLHPKRGMGRNKKRHQSTDHPRFCPQLKFRWPFRIGWILECVCVCVFARASIHSHVYIYIYKLSFNSGDTDATRGKRAPRKKEEAFETFCSPRWGSPSLIKQQLYCWGFEQGVCLFPRIHANRWSFVGPSV